MVLTSACWGSPVGFSDAGLDGNRIACRHFHPSVTVVHALSEPIDLTSDITADLIRRARARFTDGRVDGMSYDKTHPNVPISKMLQNSVSKSVDFEPPGTLSGPGAPDPVTPMALFKKY